MAESQKKPFNLLYKIDAQLTFVDKLYEIVVGPARIVVVGVMIVIIGAFLYRFPLDSALNDQVKESRSNGVILNRVLNNQEKLFRDTIKRTIEVKTYQAMYKDSTNPTVGSSYKLSYALEELENVKATFADDIVVSDYSLSTDNTATVVKVNGGATTFAKIDEFLRAIRALEFVADASSTSQTAQRGQIPKFSIDIKLKA